MSDIYLSHKDALQSSAVLWDEANYTFPDAVRRKPFFHGLAGSVKVLVSHLGASSQGEDVLWITDHSESFS